MLVSVEQVDSGMTYPWSLSSLVVVVLLPWSLLQKVKQHAEHLVLVVICLTYSVPCIRGRNEENSLCGVSLRDAHFCV